MSKSQTYYLTHTNNLGGKSSHIKLVSTSPVNKANIKIKIKTNHENLLNDVLYSYQLHKKVR
jgi:hypothetical protein